MSDPQRHAAEPEPNVAELRARIAELEARAREQEERFHALVEGSFDGLAVLVAGKIVEANSTFAKMSGYTREEVLGLTPFDLAEPASAELALEYVRKGLETPYEAVGKRKDGSTFPCEVLGRNIVYQGQPARLSGFRDLSERKRAERGRKQLEDRVQRAQELETLGVLAGGVAHDFNNLMLVVLGHTELGQALLAKERAGSSRHELIASGIAPALRGDASSSGIAPALRGDASLIASGHLEQIRGAALRARELTQQMLTYAGRAQPAAETLDLSALVRERAELLRLSIPERAELGFELASELAAIEADPALLGHLLVDLVKNAGEALAAQGGRVVVRSSNARLTAAALGDACFDHSAGPGDFVRLEVEDDGCGMDAATRARIFEPFFSSKFIGRGLGLSSTLGIVRAHKGVIRVRSEPGHGSCFSLYFPVAGERARVAPHARVDAAEFRSHGLALIADDERMLRTVGAEILRSIGFEVLVACDGQEAVELFGQHADEIRLVLLDATMPRKSGADALREIRALRQDTAVILVSGYQEADESLPPGDNRSVFLAKPFEIEALTRKLRDLLG